MAARVESFPVSSALVRRLLAPSLPWASIAAFFASLTQRLLEPRLPRMSEEWLQNLDRGAGHTLE